MVQINNTSSRRTLRIALALLFSVLAGVSAAQSVTLFGGVQHSDYEAPVSRYNQTFGTQLQVYQSTTPQLFNGGIQQSTEYGAPQAAPSFQAQPARRIDWFRVPPWMAGTWHKKGDMTVQVTDYRNGRTSNMQQWTDDELTVTWGHQVDRQGNIWEANFVPDERDAVSDAKNVRFMLVDCHCEHSSPEQVITRMHYIVSESQGWGGGVEQFQQESLNDYTPVSANELQNYSSTRVFSYEGHPTRDGMLMSRFQRLSAFHPIASKNGVDLKASLCYYLRTHGMPELATDQSAGNNSIPVVPEPKF